MSLRLWFSTYYSHSYIFVKSHYHALCLVHRQLCLVLRTYICDICKYVKRNVRDRKKVIYLTRKELICTLRWTFDTNYASYTKDKNSFLLPLYLSKFKFTLICDAINRYQIRNKINQKVILGCDQLLYTH